MGTLKSKTLQYKEGSYPPVSPIPRPGRISDRLLTPMDENIRKALGGKPLYSNRKGEIFTVRTVHHPWEYFEGQSPCHIIIEEVTRKGDKPYTVGVRLEINKRHDLLRIADIHNSYSNRHYNEPPEERKGYNFFQIIVEHAKIVARELGLSRIVIIPANDKLSDYYSKFGFEGTA